MASIEYYATGRRKTSSARVFLRPGTQHHCQPSRVRTFFPTEALRTQVRRPLLVTETAEKFDILATVAGGGMNGQAAPCPGHLARALEFNAELRKHLKKDGLLTSDSRVKERKKDGLAGARKRFQFSKR